MANIDCAVGAGPMRMMFSTRLYRIIVIMLTVSSSHFVLSTAFHLPSGTSPSMQQPQQYFNLFSLYSAPVRSSVSHDLDAIEDEFIREQSLQSNSKSKRTRSRRKSDKATVDKNGSKLTEATIKSNKRRQRGSKLSSPTTSTLPPWLSQYENDNLLGSYQQKIDDTESPSLTSFADIKENFDGETQHTATPMQRLQMAMCGVFSYPDAEPAVQLPNAISYFTPSEMNEVLDSIRVASHSNSNLMAGCAEFLYMMLTLEEEGLLPNDLVNRERWDDDDIDHSADEWDENSRKPTSGGSQPHSIMTRDVLIAAAFHYCDCVRARKAGVYDYVRETMGASLELPVWKELEKKQEIWLPSAENKTDRNRQGRTRQDDTPIEVDASFSTKTASITTVKRRGKSPIERYGKESTTIAAGAARLKRAEIMASVNKRNPNPSNYDAETLRSFLVTLSEDWRGLVIRSAACLYRLKGIVDGPESSGKVVLSTTTIRTARDALRVYAPLAQRLGMQRLKSELENNAFRILYRRQYSVASSLYGDVDEMKAIVQVLTSRIEQLLRSDPIFIEQIEDVTVSSRVKEPYSLWRKMLRIRMQVAGAKKRDDTSATNDLLDSEAVSIRWIPDAIALRVVLRASKLWTWEEEDSLRTREKMLCYYALQLISDVWPVSTANKAKDYIQNPKRNGYQSLHYTANLMINGDEWPFEVQIRSEEMHRIAEFGVAAHWDYKLETKAAALPESSSPVTNIPILALPPTSHITDTRAKRVIVSESDIEPQSTKIQRKGRIESYIEALTMSRLDLVQNNLFVFISSTDSALDGHLLSIDPSIASITGVLEKYGVEVLSVFAKGEVFRNGLKVTVDQELCNGDVLTLPASLVDRLMLN